MLSRYVQFEERAQRRRLRGAAAAGGEAMVGRDESSEDDDEEEEEEEQGESATVMLMVAAFARLRHEAYRPSVLLILRAVRRFSREQFAQNVSWLAPLLSRLILCENIEVRLCLRDIHREAVIPLIVK